MKYWKTIKEACEHGRSFSLLLTCSKCKIYFWFADFMACPKCHDKYPEEVKIPGTDMDYEEY